MKRRDILKGTISLPLLPQSKKSPIKPVHILIAGGHPDDPETGCGGSIAKWIAEGHQVTVVYLTRGEKGINGLKPEEAANIRTQEATEACKILGCTALFLNQIDGETIVNNEWYERVRKLLSSQKPDVILTHWPIDTHRDHRTCSLLFYDAWLTTGMKESFYYYEVMSGIQTQNFAPTHYVDISKYYDLKKKAVLIHESQFKNIYDDAHMKMEVFRGIEYGSNLAEAFIKHGKSKDCPIFAS
ncbi:MAG: PIG-L deacetylase family protein [Leadbetterella sp.]